MGVGFGTALTCLLWHRYHSFIGQAIRLSTPFELSIAALLWAAAGLTFCYLASVPMLTIHTSRVLLQRCSWTRRRWIALILFLMIPEVAICSWSQWIGCGELAQKCALVVLWLVVAPQAFLITCVLVWPQETMDFYDRLEAKRPQYPGLVESYRHMREHGNSVLIVLGELILTYCLWEVLPSAKPSPDESSVLLYVGLVLFFWLLPSGLVWMVGTRLEMHLSERENRSFLD
jgi:hypothetical protein